MEPTIRLAIEEDAEAVTAIYTPIVKQMYISFSTEPPISLSIPSSYSVI